jgi:hypothetical protein
MLLDYPDKSGLQHTRGTWESVLCRNSRILVELPHLTDLELGKLYRSRENSSRTSALEVLQGLSTCRKVLWPSKPRISLYSIRTKLGSTLEAELRRSSHLLSGRVWGLSRCFVRKWGSRGPLVRPADHLGWPAGHVLWPDRLSLSDPPITDLTWHVLRV